LAASSSVVLATESAGLDVSAPVSEWLIETVDATREVGYNVSVATDTVTGDMYISYYEGNDGDLWLARTGAPVGNCGPMNEWECRQIDTVGATGKYSSIAVGGTGQFAEVWISYHWVSTGSLMVAELTFDRASGASETEHIYGVDMGDLGNDIFKGTQTAIVVDGAGTPHIAYQIKVSSLEAIKYATPVAPGTGNCASEYWECSHVYLEQSVGDFIAIDVDLGGNPSMAFHTGFSTHTFPIVATRRASGGTCNNSDLWDCIEVRNGGQFTGDYLAFVLGDNSQQHLAYRNEHTDSLEWATWVGSPNGNCGPNHDSWQCEWIDDIGPGTSPAGIAMETDSDGNPIIVYQDLESGYEDLKIARPLGALSWPAAGNCGPLSPMFFPTWHCETLDAGDLSHDEAVGGLSIALNANDEATVAYRELFDPIITPERGRLKVAMEPQSIFADGFESGDTSMWSAVVP